MLRKALFPALFAAALLVACNGGSGSQDSWEEELTESSGSESSSSKKVLSSSSVAVSSSAEKFSSARENVIEDREVSGVVPFVKGTSVVVHELDDETMELTGRHFGTEVLNDSGTYSVSGISTTSKYVAVEAYGHYRNAVTGDCSGMLIAMKALSDISGRSNVNVNLLTQLEYERVVKLVLSGMDIAAAKRQAETEILDVFGFAEIVDKFDAFEDIEMGVGEGDSNESGAALLAIGLLMRGDLSDAGFLLRLKSLDADFAEDGKWDDSVDVSVMADWARQADANGKLGPIRRNFEAWKLGTVPDFEKYVRMFWYAAFGLDSCAESMNGKVVPGRNKWGGGDSLRFFLCRDGLWNEMGDAGRDVYEWDAGEDGEIRKGEVTGSIYRYDVTLGQWAPASPRDTSLGFGGCTVKRMGEVVKSSADETYYICKDSEWQKAREKDYDTYGEKCTSENEGAALLGLVTHSAHYYCSAEGWQTAMPEWNVEVPKDARMNLNFDYGSFTDERDGRVYKSVIVGEQEWMAENLNYYNENLAFGIKCYNGDTLYCRVLGRLYSWSVAMDSAGLFSTAGSAVRGICPEGWHLPSVEEFKTLLLLAGGSAEGIGDELITSTGWGNGGGGPDSYGFSALPGGYSYGGDKYGGVGTYAYFWTTDAYDDKYAYNLYMVYVDEDYKYTNVTYDSKVTARSVRCIKDMAESSPSP